MGVIKLNSVAFRNHMRAKTVSLKPWCLFLADDFAVFEFGYDGEKSDEEETKEAYDKLVKSNEYYGYGLYTDGESRIAVTNPDKGE